MIRVLVVDDHTIVRVGLQRLLEQSSDIEIVGVADRGEQAVTLDAELEPDVVLMDLSMPGQSGIESTRKICASRQGASVVILTASTDPNQIVDAFDAGAVGYLVKDSDPQVLVEGVRSAANGDSPLDARAARYLLRGRHTNHHSASQQLTKRERDVLELVSRGLANKAIARSLGISEKTVKAHLTRVFAAIGVSDRTQAALWAKEHLSLSP
ncbi:MAG: response regulator [Acidimicrobiales bacterium]